MVGADFAYATTCGYAGRRTDRMQIICGPSQNGEERQRVMVVRL